MIWILVLAHLGSSHSPPGETLRKASILSIVKVIDASTPTSEGSETKVARVEDVVGVSAPQMTLVQRGPHTHALKAGTLVLAPLSRSPAGRWLYDARTRSALEVRAGELRATRRFVGDWRKPPPETPGDRLDAWIGLALHSSATGRLVGFDQLTRHASDLERFVDAARLQRLAQPLFEPDTSVERKAAVLRLLAIVGRFDAADLLARRWSDLSPQRLRHLAAGVMARFPTRPGRKTVRACSRGAGGALRERCLRLLPRFERAP